MAGAEDELAEAYNEALRLEKSGMRDEAALLYRRCLDLDPDDTCGASVRLASMGMGQTPSKAPDAYVATLFDQHAEVFDDILTGELGYAIPMQLGQIMPEIAPGPYARMLDLGCGTGLAGMMLQPLCEYAIGVDLSEKMIDEADERACYDELFINEAVHFLEEWAKLDDEEHQPFDLIVATDVLPYVGALEALFDGMSANTVPGAVIAFSAETLPDVQLAGRDWSITPHQRFAHAVAYLEAMCARAGFSEQVLKTEVTVRLEQGKPIPGWLIIARRP